VFPAFGKGLIAIPARLGKEKNEGIFSGARGGSVVTSVKVV